MSLRMQKFALTGFVVVVAALLAMTAQAFAQDPLDSFRNGLAEYKKGNLSDYMKGGVNHPGAATYFQQAMRDSSRMGRNSADGLEKELSKQAQRMIEDATFEVIMQMLTVRSGDEATSATIRAFAQWILTKSERPFDERIGRYLPQDIARDVDRAMNSVNLGDRIRWIEVLRERYGEFILPEIHRSYFSSGDEETEARAIALIATLGRSAVMPLVELMESPSETDKLHAAVLLGDARDIRALPALVDHATSDASTETVKTQCLIAIQKIVGPLPSPMPPAWEYYYRLALKYYHQLPELIYGRAEKWVVWKWVPDDLNDPSAGGHLDFNDRVPLWGYMDALAEEAALDALDAAARRGALDERDDRDVLRLIEQAWDLLVCINAREWLEASARHRIGDQAEVEEFDTTFARSWRGRVLISSAGVRPLYSALRRCLEERTPELAVELCNALAIHANGDLLPRTTSDYNRSTGRYNETIPGTALVEALFDEDARVRYAAAQALFRISPEDTFSESDTAMNVILDGLRQNAQRRMLVITADLNLRNHLRDVLTELGYLTTYADDVRRGLRELREFGGYDLVLLDYDIANTPVQAYRPNRDDSFGFDEQQDPSNLRETIFDLLQDDFRTSQLPVFLMVRDLAGDAGLRRRVKDLFADYFDNDDRLVDQRLIPLDSDGRINEVATELGKFQPIWEDNDADIKNRANWTAIRCAEALGYIQPGTEGTSLTEHALTEAAKALVARVYQEGTRPEVKVACLKTLHKWAEFNPGGTGPFSPTWHASNIIPNLLPALDPEGLEQETAPLVWYWAAKTLGQVYAHHWTHKPLDRETAQGNLAWTTGTDAESKAFTVLMKLADHDVDFADLGEFDPDEEVNDLRVRELNHWVHQARAAAGDAFGFAPHTSAQALYWYQHLRVNRKHENNRIESDEG